MDEQVTLAAEVRATLPSVVQAYLAYLEDQVAHLREQIPPLQATVAKLQAQMADLQARAAQNSGNSSRPPSSDPPDARPYPKRKPSGRKKGAQTGHLGHTRVQLSDE